MISSQRFKRAETMAAHCVADHCGRCWVTCGSHKVPSTADAIAKVRLTGNSN